MVGAVGMSVLDVRSVNDAEALLAQLEREEVSSRRNNSKEGVLYLGLKFFFFYTSPYGQAEVVTELDQLLEQQTQMDIKMSSFKHMLYEQHSLLHYMYKYHACTVDQQLIVARGDQPLMKHHKQHSSGKMKY